MEFLKFFLLNNLILNNFDSKKIEFWNKATYYIYEPDSVYKYLKKFLNISDFEDSIKVLPLFLLSGIELKKEKLSDYKKYFNYLDEKYFKLLTIFENIEKTFFENVSLKDTFLYYAYLLNAINFKKEINFDFVKKEPEFLFAYSFMKFNSGNINEAERFLNEFLKDKKNYYSDFYDDALYLLSLIERLKGNESKEIYYLLRIKDEFPLTDYKYELFLRLLSLYFDREEYSKILEIRNEIKPFFNRLIPYFYASFAFEGKVDSAENIIMLIKGEERRDSIRYFTEDKLIKRKKYDIAEKILDKFENKESDKYFKLSLDVFFLNERDNRLKEIFLKEKDEKRRFWISKILGKLYFKKENYRESKKYYQIAYDIMKRDDILYSLLFTKFKLGEIDEESFYRDFLKEAKDTLLIKKTRSDFHFYLKKRDRFRDSEENLVSLLNLCKDKEEKKFFLKELYEIERFLKNDSLFLEILKKNSKNDISSFTALLAFEYMIERNFPEEKVFSFLSNFEIESNEDGRKLFYKLSELYLKKEKFKEAKVLLKDLINERDSISDKAILKLGEISIIEKNLSLLDTVIDYLVNNFEKDNPFIYYFLAQKEEFKGNNERAIELYEKAAINFKMDRNGAARMLLKAALISPPEKKDLYFKRAIILAEDEKLKKEIEEKWKKEMF
ncbi:MAG: hypothetical protein ABIM85_00545 [candidate division WOR-3 bacterium]